VTRLVGLALLALAAGAAAGRDPSANGPFAVGVTTVTLVDAVRSRTLVTEVWNSADVAGRDAGIRRGRYPLVLMAHGNCGFRIFAALPAPAFLVTLVGGTHSGFTDVDARVTPGQLARQQAITRRYAVAFLERYIGGRRGQARYLTPEDAAREGMDVELTARAR